MNSVENNRGGRGVIRFFASMPRSAKNSLETDPPYQLEEYQGASERGLPLGFVDALSQFLTKGTTTGKRDPLEIICVSNCLPDILLGQ